MIKAYFAGICEPNCDGGKMGYGYTIYHHEAKIREFAHLYKRRDIIASNHISDYCGVYAAMHWLILHGFNSEEVYIFGHAKLPIFQLQALWSVNAGKYSFIAIQTRALLFDFPNIKFELIPKSQNMEAVNLAESVL